jgi:hypothetical protein
MTPCARTAGKFLSERSSSTPGCSSLVCDGIRVPGRVIFAVRRHVQTSKCITSPRHFPFAREVGGIPGLHPRQGILAWLQQALGSRPEEIDRHQRRRTVSRSTRKRHPGWHPPALTPAYKTSVLRSPGSAPLSPLSLQNSLSEMTGPIFNHNELGPLDNDLILNFAKTGEPIGERIVVHGRVLDENRRPVPGTLLELWQAKAGTGTRPIPTLPRWIPTSAGAGAR